MTEPTPQPLSPADGPVPEDPSVAGARLVEVRVSMPDAESARQMSTELVGAQLAACVQILGPMTSVYTWEGEAQEATEWLLLAKTTAERFPALTEHVVAQHLYDVPEVLAVPVAHALGAYGAWVRDGVAAAD